MESHQSLAVAISINNFHIHSTAYSMFVMCCSYVYFHTNPQSEMGYIASAFHGNFKHFQILYLAFIAKTRLNADLNSFDLIKKILLLLKISSNFVNEKMNRMFSITKWYNRI